MALKFLNDGYFAGKVGIGTESPSVALQLGNSTLGQTKLAIFNSEGGGEVGLTIKSRTNRAKLRVADNDSNAYVVAEAGKSFFGTSANGDANNITVLTGGNVGIGTTSPGTKLDISVTPSAPWMKLINADETAFNLTTYNNGTNNGNTVYAFKHGLYYNSTENAAVTFYRGGSSVGGFLTFTTNNGTERMRIDSAGNVGIGTTNPLSQLSIGSNAITTKKPTVIIADGVAGGSLVIRGLSPILSFDRTGASPENKILMDGVGLEFKTGSLDAEGDVDFKIKLDGKLQAPAYTQGFLQSDANGNIEISGGGTLPGGPYLPLAGGTMTGTAGVVFPDAFKLNLGTGSDLEIYHNGLSGNNNIDNINGDLYMSQYANDKDIIFRSDNGFGGVTEYFRLDGGSGYSVASKDIRFDDNVKAKFGISNDLQIYHDGSNSQINDIGTGDLYIQASDNMYFQTYGSGKRWITLNENASVDLFYNDSKKFETTSGGVSVTGDIQIDSALLSNQENTDVDTGTETVANVAVATYTAAFFDFVIKKTTNVRSGTVYACHDGTNVEFTETSTQDLGDTSDVTLSVDISGGNMRLLATVTSDDWSVKSLIRAI